MKQNIVILGGSHAGISTAHRLLKSTSASMSQVKITLVTPNTHHYWNLASPRAILPRDYNEDSLFEDIAQGFSQYPADRFEFVLGTASRLDVSSQIVEVRTSTLGTGESQIKYDFLVLATGSHSTGDAPFKSLDTTESTRAAIREFRLRVERANSIVVAGAGVTGVEVAGELGFVYGTQKKITLVRYTFSVNSVYFTVSRKAFVISN